ncbi:hypothetical protein AB835_13720 [Candidatus Endobugula sertula]|uniref:Peptidase n=1 Tax=Candidatus Endobugula sertula TaxID=62101 RepID=A0A1D2QLR9_9GAMM|nr:hypothetical protein AB835_13720 [Candidatus Endobugula sertula]
MSFVQSIPIIDGHNDTIKQAFCSGRDLFSISSEGHIDFPRAKSAGMAGGFFSLLVIPEEQQEFGYGLTITENGWEVNYPSPLTLDYAKSRVEDMLLFMQSTIDADDSLIIAKKLSEIEQAIAKKNIFFIIHFEGADMIDKDVSNLEDYYNRGLRSLGLVWSRPNVFGSGVPFKFPSSPDIGPGLTKAGLLLVKRCNELGIIIDLTHLNQKGFYDVANNSQHPLVVSHAAAHAICPSTTNLLDCQLDAIKDSGGVVGSIFDIVNCRADGLFKKDTPLDIFIDHIKYFVDYMGIDHVCLGPDFDGAVMPSSFQDVTYYPRLIKYLSENGFNQQALEKLCYKNWLRVIKQTWHH